MIELTRVGVRYGPPADDSRHILSGMFVLVKVGFSVLVKRYQGIWVESSEPGLYAIDRVRVGFVWDMMGLGFSQGGTGGG